MPEVAFSFTIPSIHDDTILDCRIYLPLLSSITGEAEIVGAIMAHPYAPLGGCYDDPVVRNVVEELLKQGCFVGTFNFRGVYGGNGHTSWTSKPETQDYISFAGFFAHYLDLIERTLCHNTPEAVSPPRLHPLSATNPYSTPTQDGRSEVKLILGGYSYGSIIASRLPPLRSILSHFQNAKDGTAVAEILHRARTMSGWTNEKLETARQNDVRQPKQPRRHSPSISMGGEETPSDQRRISREDSRRSVDLEGLRRSLDIPRRIKEHKSHSRSREQAPSPAEKDGCDDVDLPSTKPQYLLVSPVLGIVGSALSAFNVHGEATDVNTTLAREPSLVIYGDKDVFTSTRRIRQWTQKLGSNSNRFRAIEVNGAGHFWREHGVAGKLGNAINSWVQELREASN